LTLGGHLLSLFVERTNVESLAGLFVGQASTLADSQYVPNHKTLEDAVGEAIELSAIQEPEIAAVVATHLEVGKFICTGILLAGQSERMNIVVRKRAKVACEYTNTLNSKLSN